MNRKGQCVEMSDYSKKPRYIPREDLRGAWEEVITMPDTYIIFDTETTGLINDDDRYQPEIIEIAAVKVINNKLTDETFETFIKPSTGYLPEKAMSVNKITYEMLEKAPTQEKALASFYEFAKGFLLMGWNSAGYDVPLLQISMSRHLPQYDFNFYTMDLLKFGRLLDPISKHNLGATAAYWGVENPDEHRAMGDVMTTFWIYEKMQEAYGLENMYNAANQSFGSKVRRIPAAIPAPFYRCVNGQLVIEKPDPKVERVEMRGSRAHVLCMPEQYILIDEVRTGNHSSKGAELAGIFAKKIEYGQVVDEFRAYIQVKDLDPETLTSAMDLNMYYAYARPVEDVLLEFYNWSKGYMYVGYTCKDFGKFLQVEYSKYLPEGIEPEIYYCEIEKMVRQYYKKKLNSYKLPDVCNALCILTNFSNDIHENRLGAMYLIYNHLLQNKDVVQSNYIKYYKKWPDSYMVLPTGFEHQHPVCV